MISQQDTETDEFVNPQITSPSSSIVHNVFPTTLKNFKLLHILILIIIILVAVFSILYLLPYQKVFDQTPHKLQIIPQYKLFRINHADYLNKKSMKTVLEINCGEECKKKYADNQEYKKLEADFDKDTKKSYDWLNIHNDEKNPHLIIMQVQKYAKLVTNGVTLFFRNTNALKNFKTSDQQFFLSQMRELSFVYDETTSLNLRRREGCIMLIFAKHTILNNPPFPLKPPTKNYIAIQTVLKFNQNIPYLREWIGYHVHLGIDKFFLYDNSGTEGQTGKSNQTHNKYAFPLQCLNTSNEYIIEEFNSIWEQFYQHIVYVPWQPTNEKGLIMYEQVDSMKDYINNFGDVTTYSGFIDIDEMLFSELNIPLDQYITQKSLEGWSAVSFQQHKMVNRFCYNNSRVMDMMNLAFQVNTKTWAEKQIFQNNLYYPGNNVHDGRVYKGKIFLVDNKTQWRFNHYNVNQGMVVNLQRAKLSNRTKLHLDDSGKRYTEALDKICMGKCSERFKIACNKDDPQQVGKFKCPVYGKEYPIQP